MCIAMNFKWELLDDPIGLQLQGVGEKQKSWTKEPMAMKERILSKKSTFDLFNKDNGQCLQSTDGNSANLEFCAWQTVINVMA